MRLSVSASTDLAAQYFYQIGRSAMEYQLGRFELSLRLLDDVDPEQLASFDDPRESLTHSYRSWLLSALDRVDEAMAVAEDGLACAQRDLKNRQCTFSKRGKASTCSASAGTEADAALDRRFHLADAHQIVGVLDAASVVALGRTKLHIGDERAAREVAQIAQVMHGTTTAPVVRKLAAWYLAVHSMASGDSNQAHRWLCALGETERLSLFPLFPMEAADDPLLVPSPSLPTMKNSRSQSPNSGTKARTQSIRAVHRGSRRSHPRSPQSVQTRPRRSGCDSVELPATAGPRGGARGSGLHQAGGR